MWYLPGVTGWFHRSEWPETAGSPGLACGPDEGGGNLGCGLGHLAHPRGHHPDEDQDTFPPTPPAQAWHMLRTAEFTRNEPEKRQEHEGSDPPSSVSPEAAPQILTSEVASLNPSNGGM